MTAKLYERYEYLSINTFATNICIVILILASLAGTIGNCFVLTVTAFRKNSVGYSRPGKVFIANLAISDLWVTVVVNSMSVVGK